MTRSMEPKSKLISFWEQFNRISTVLEYCRVSTVVVVAGLAGLLFVPQGKEIAVRLGDEPTYMVLFFLLATLAWAFISWYWARLILDIKVFRPPGSPPLPGFHGWLVRYLPRLIGGLASFSATLSLFFAARDAGGNSAFQLWWAFWISALFSILFLLFVRFRRDFFPARLQHRILPPGRKRIWLALHNKLRPTQKHQAIEHRPPLWLVAGGFALTVILFIWALWSPVTMGWGLGAGPVIFLALTLIAQNLGYLVYLTAGPGAPILKIALVLAILFSVTNDNHVIRPYKHPSVAEGVPAPTRVPITEAFKDWGRSGANQSQKAPRPLIMVATAGGGLRAAYWTATVLGAAADASCAFAPNLFAVSGVSGGSLGAAVFNQVLLHQYGEQCPKFDSLPPTDGSGRIEDYAQRALSQDFLGPAAASMFFPDLTQRFLPVGFLPDRAAALESAWESGWDRALPEVPGRMGDPFILQWKRRVENSLPWLPALLLNGTHQESGKRIVTSNLVLETEKGAVLPDAMDFFHHYPCDIRTSTAAHNSARFTYVSPAGTVTCGENPPAGHLVDGGYFENNAAVTARQLLEHVMRLAGKSVGPLRPLVIQITNDPKLPMEPPPFADRLPPPEPQSNFLNEITAPIRALLAAWNARSFLATKELKAWVEELNRGDLPNKAEFFHFRLRPNQDANMSLGWVLSKDSEREIRAQLRQGENQAEFQRLVEILKP